MRVAELMNTNVACVRSDESLSAAARLMRDRDCGAVPVTDDTGRVVAMVTDRDICMSAWSQDLPPSRIRVADAMSPDVYHCSQADSVSFAESIMLSRRLRRLPVLDHDRKLVGILSLADIARRLDTSGTTASDEELSPGPIAFVLASISQPGSPRPNAGARA